MADWLHVKDVKGGDVTLNLGNVASMERMSDETTLISFLGGKSITVREKPAELLSEIERVQREQKERRADERRAKRVDEERSGKRKSRRR